MSATSSIRDSVLKHWRNSSISLSRSGSKREKNEVKAAKRKSIQPVTTTTVATTKSSESQIKALSAKAPEKPMDDNSSESANAFASPFKSTSVHVTVHVAPENVEKFLAAFKKIFDVVAAEPECLFFEVYKSAEEPGKISWIENWGKDMQWLMENQITKPYYKEYFETTEPMFLKPREFQVFEPVGPGFTMTKANH